MSTTSRGYGHAHQVERRRWAPRVALGEVGCARCGDVIEPGEAWDLDHDDTRTGYLGPSHASCNRSAGAVKGNTGGRERAVYTPSIDW